MICLQMLLCIYSACLQVLPTEVVTMDNSSLASFLMACLVAPSHLGVPVVDAEKAHRLGQSAKVRRQLAASRSSTC